MKNWEWEWTTDKKWSGSGPSYCGNFHNLGGSLRIGDRFAVLEHTFNMKLDGFPDLLQQFLAGVGRSHAAKQVWHIGGRCA